MGFYDSFGTFGDTFDPYFTLVTSPFFNSFILAHLRLAIAIYTTVTIIVDFILNGTIFHKADRYFSFFTHLSHIGLCAYFWAATIQTFFFAFKQKYPLRRWAPFLQLLQVLLQSSILTFPFVVSIAFWTLLSKGAFATRFFVWSNLSLHALNLVYAFFEILLTNDAPMPWMTLPINLVLLLLYTALAYITHATQGFYPYTFLDPSIQHIKVLGYIVGVLVGECIIFVVVRQLMVWRGRIHEKSLII